jgi:quercetin dioxygenase-like cupin family protein
VRSLGTIPCRAAVGLGPEHAHENEQITVVTRGAMRFTLDGETKVLRAGDGVCIPRNVPHEAVVLGEETEAYDAWNPPREDYRTSASAVQR